MRRLEAASFEASIYMAGDIATAKAWLRRRCYQRGLCVTVSPCDFIYTGGEETGFRVGLVNYPRFPSTTEHVHETAVELASSLVVECCQKTALVVSGLKSEWLHTEPPGARASGAESKP